MTSHFWGRWARILLVTALALANVIGLLRLGAEVAEVGLAQAIGHVGFDWLAFQEAGALAVSGGNPYEAVYRWTPAAAWLLHWLTLVPWPVWLLAHVAAALTMPSWMLRALTLLAYPFWYDVMVGNIMVFVALLAVWAVRGSAWATGGFLAIAVLAPRPLMLPVAAWILWKRSKWRLPAAGMAVAALAGSLLVGNVDAWFSRLLESGGQVEEVVNLSPSAFIGLAWVPIGVVLAVWLFWRGRLGWASVTIQPYLIPNYLLMLLMEADQPTGREKAR